jgi:N-acetylglutamate synthase-like GNAT family acetyltransferase
MSFIGPPQLPFQRQCVPPSSRCARTKRRAYIHACGQIVDGRLRRGIAQDTLTLAGLIAKEGMNPFLGDPRTFIVYETSDGRVVGCGNVRGSELASLVVATAYRRQGIASSIVKELLKENSGRDLFLLTLDTSAPFYGQFGFHICDDSEISAGMRIEKFLGNRVAPLVVPGSSCVAMRRPAIE